MNLKDKVIAVWFSCGAASAVAAKMTLDRYGSDNIVRIVNNPIKEEHEDNLRFLKDVESWLGCEVEFATNSKYPSQSCVEVWDKRKFMSSPYGAPCTLELKKGARQEWESENHCDYLVLGFTADETHRADRFKLSERSELLTPLIEANYTKQDCFLALAAAKIELPEIYKFGFPNANCIGCVKASSATYWNLVRKQFPDVFNERAVQSRDIGAKLVRVNGERIFLDELSPDSVGHPLERFDFECGLFCEEI